MRSAFLRVSPLVALAFLACTTSGVDLSTENVGTVASKTVVCQGATTVQGIDVSSYQGTPDWTTVAGGDVHFAIARISDGNDLDTAFADNWKGIAAAKLVRGAYQYFEPGDDPDTIAAIVVNAVGKLGNGDLPVVADVETTGGQSAATIVANLQEWFTKVEAGTGKRPFIYTGKYFWEDNVGDSTVFAADPLWIAAYPGTPATCVDTADAWSKWSIWQFEDNGTFSGISGGVDTDRFNGTLADLETFAGGADWGAQFVSQSFPLATTAMTMTTGQSVAADIVMRNIGSKSWDSNTRLGTTQPRDRVSAFAASDWVSTSRPSEVTGTIAPGDTYKFTFTLHAPSKPGNYKEYFGLLEEGVAWFSDPGELGPADDDIEIQINVVEGEAGSDDAGTAEDAGTPATDGGLAVETGVSDASLSETSTGVDGGVVGDGGPAAEGGVGHSSAAGGGCATTTSSNAPIQGWISMLMVGAVARISRRRRR